MPYFALTQEIVLLVVLLALLYIEKERNVLTEKNVLCAQSASMPLFSVTISWEMNTVNVNNNLSSPHTTE